MFHRLLFKNFILLLLISLTQISCGGGGDGTTTDTNQTTTPSTFQGTYSGTFSGSDSGTWTLTIAADGKATGTAIVTTQQNTVIPLTGTISVGGSSTLTGATGVVTYTLLIDSTGKVTGTWADSQSGTGGTVTGSLNSGTGGTSKPITFGSIDLDSTDFGKKKFTPTEAKSNTILVQHIGTTATKPGDVISSLTSFDSTGKFAAIAILLYRTDQPNTTYCYQLNCIGATPDAACSNISTDSVKKTITFNNAVLPVLIDNTGCNAAMAPMTTLGTLNW